MLLFVLIIYSSVCAGVNDEVLMSLFVCFLRIFFCSQFAERLNVDGSRISGRLYKFGVLYNQRI